MQQCQFGLTLHHEVARFLELKYFHFVHGSFLFFILISWIVLIFTFVIFYTNCLLCIWFCYYCTLHYNQYYELVFYTIFYDILLLLPSFNSNDPNHDQIERISKDLSKFSFYSYLQETFYSVLAIYISVYIRILIVF